MPMLDLSGKFAVISLESPDAFIFDLFPREIQSTDRANWEAQDVTRGTKPLFYANNEPRRLSISECWIDGSNTNQDIVGQISALRALKNELPKTGAPPALLVVYGEQQLRCVLEEVSIAENFFTRAGDPLRARCSLQFIELQEVGTAVSSTVSPAEGPSK